MYPPIISELFRSRKYEAVGVVWWFWGCGTRLASGGLFESTRPPPPVILPPRPLLRLGLAAHSRRASPFRLALPPSRHAGMRARRAKPGATGAAKAERSERRGGRITRWGWAGGTNKKLDLLRTPLLRTPLLRTPRLRTPLLPLLQRLRRQPRVLRFPRHGIPPHHRA